MVDYKSFVRDGLYSLGQILLWKSVSIYGMR